MANTGNVHLHITSTASSCIDAGRLWFFYQVMLPHMGPTVLFDSGFLLVELCFLYIFTCDVLSLVKLNWNRNPGWRIKEVCLLYSLV